MERGELLGRIRYVVALPHPNARVPAHGLAGNLGPQLTGELRQFLSSRTLPAVTARAPGTPPAARAAPPAVPPALQSLAAAGDGTPATGRGPAGAPQLFGITTRKRDRNGDPAQMPGVNYVVTAVRTPWQPGVIRVIDVTGADPRWRVGQLVDLVNASTGLRLGQYEVVAGHRGRAPVWDLL